MASDPAMPASRRTGVMLQRGERMIKNILNQCRFTGAAHARDADEPVQWNGDINVFKVVFGGSVDLKFVLGAVGASTRTSSPRTLFANSLSQCMASPTRLTFQ